MIIKQNSETLHVQFKKSEVNKHAIKIFAAILIGLVTSCSYQQGNTQGYAYENLRLVSISEIKTGAQQTDLYFLLLKDKALGLVCNHTSLIGEKHILDTLLNAGFNVRALFSPEHGFRGEAGAGDLVIDGIDQATGTPIVSLYGSKKKPSPGDMKGIELMVFDIQDAGVRFYTYISTLALVMEACAENDIPLLVLDRPNPNGFYIDGPVLDTSLKSFVGMHPVPIVYGMTIGEYALMVNGEGWLKAGISCNLTLIPLKDWDRMMIVELPFRPSPNLPTWQSIYLYPSICLFEGTVVSVGRGTDYPFQVIGHPGLKTGSYTFTPESIKGIAEKPPYMGEICHGQLLTGFAENFRNNDHHFTLEFLESYYQELELKEKFFNNYFEKLAGVKELRYHIQESTPEDEIRLSWSENLDQFRIIRKKYLVYPDID